MTVARQPAIGSGHGFWLFAGVVALGNVLLLSIRPDWLGEPVPEWPLAVDLLVLVPVAYLVVNRAKGRRAWLGAVALAGIGVLLGSLLLPSESKHVWSTLEALRHWLLAAVVAVQSAIVIAAVVQVWRASRTGNAESAIDRTLRARFGPGLVTDLLRLESRVWLYALLRNPVTVPFPGRNFSSHRQGFNAANQVGFVILMAAEIPVMHGLLHLFFGAIPALAVTVLSLYGWLFLLAEYRATLHRPISLDDNGVHLRYGVVTDIVLPWHAVTAVESCCEAGPRRHGTLRLRGMGEANVRVSLRPGTRVAGILGEREIHEISLGVDDPAGFIQAAIATIATNGEGVVAWD